MDHKSTGLIRIKILNEVLGEEKISSFISSFDFNSFSNDSTIKNMRDIIKNKLLNCITKYKIEQQLISGSRKTTSFKDKTG